MDAELLGGHGWRGISRNDQAIPYAVSRQVGRFHPAPCNGAGLPAPLVKGGVDHGQFEPCMRASSRIGTRQAHRKENATNGK